MKRISFLGRLWYKFDNRILKCPFTLIILMFFSSATFAQNDTIPLKEIIINSSKIQSTYSKLPQIITIISKDDIKNMPFQTIEDVLEHCLNVDMRKRGDNGVQADISVRGGTSDQTLIMLNGIAINDAQTGHHSMNIPVNIENIERIEIINSASAKMLGINSYSGAINIITTSEKNKSLSLSTIYGEHNLLSTNINGNYNLGKIKNNLSFSYNSCDGYTENTDFINKNIMYQGQYSKKASKIDFFAGYVDKNFGANSFYTPKYPNQYEETKTLFSNLKYNFAGKINFTANAYYRYNQDRFELDRYSDNLSKYTNNHLTQTFGASANAFEQTRFGKILFGLENKNIAIKSNVLGKKDIDEKVPFYNDKRFLKEDIRTIYNISLEHFFEISKFSSSIGFFASYSSDYNWYFLPSVDIAYNFNENIKLFSAINTTFRLPTFTELYYQSPTDMGNIDLKPETSINYELGTRYYKNFINLQLALFYRQSENTIDWTKQNIEDKWITENITKINAWGIEASADFNLKKIFSKFFIEKFIISYSNNNLEKEAGNYISKYLLDYLKNKIDCSLEHRIYKKIRASHTFSYQQRTGTHINYKENKEEKYPDTYLISSKIFYQTSSFNYFLQIDNVLNKEYMDISNVYLPKRWIKLGIKFNFNFEKK